MTPTPKWDPTKPVVPVGPDGALLSYGTYGSTFERFHRFDAVLTLVGTERGRSSLIFVWKTADGRRWPMFATDVADLIRRGDIRDGNAYGTWTVSKRGANYGLRLVP